MGEKLLPLPAIKGFESREGKRERERHSPSQGSITVVSEPSSLRETVRRRTVPAARPSAPTLSRNPPAARSKSHGTPPSRLVRHLPFAPSFFASGQARKRQRGKRREEKERTPNSLCEPGPASSLRLSPPQLPASEPPSAPAPPPSSPSVPCFFPLSFRLKRRRKEAKEIRRGKETRAPHNCRPARRHQLRVRPNDLSQEGRHVRAPRRNKSRDMALTQLTERFHSRGSANNLPDSARRRNGARPQRDDTSQREAIRTCDRPLKRLPLEEGRERESQQGAGG